MEMLAELKKAAAAMNLPLTDNIARALSCHWQLLLEANSRFNITAITDPLEAAVKHYADCLAAAAELSRLLPQGGKAADIGSGGGFPGLIMAAACPELDLTLIESSRKKCEFLQDAAAEMGLTKVKVLALRAEEAGREKDLRESFDLVTARAVADLAVLAEYSLPLLKQQGLFLAMKGPDPTLEVQAAAHALEVLAGSFEGSIAYELPGDQKRNLLLIRKNGICPDKYPRRPGMPVKKPL